MKPEITLQQLINLIKSDLFAPYDGKTDSEMDSPIFFVDGAELEVGFNVSYDDKAGLKIAILPIISSSIDSSKKLEYAHRIKIKLSPILDREELREIIEKDHKLMAKVKKSFEIALKSRFLGE